MPPDCPEWVEIPKADCDQWETVTGDESCNNWVTDEDWILITSFWQDIEHYWRDLALWQDRPTNWVAMNG